MVTALDKEVLWILGRPNFWCAPYAWFMRKYMGRDIPEHAEEEQAHVIHHFLTLYEEHGDKWREVWANTIDACDAWTKQKEEAKKGNT